ncbi:hypothetical protein GCM10027202_12090 [Microvirgula curvata]|uniref:Uncharacterized protein n=1 Tax=Microvirgula aerodenitrificans TaxID=57480 RepID=A0A2S0PC17_9NEIS|nr:glycosyltransferase [Microvirgula aerodenitrificans]AVY94817.1 hypothetical protein DAI18_12790 [Microvirgula aerodenitrificans]
MDTALYTPSPATPQQRWPLRRLGWVAEATVPDPLGVQSAWQQALTRVGITVVPVSPRPGARWWPAALRRPWRLRGLPRAHWPWLGAAREMAAILRAEKVDSLLLGGDAQSVWLGRALHRELGIPCLWWARTGLASPPADGQVLCDSFYAQAHWLAAGGVPAAVLVPPAIDLLRHDWQPPRARSGAFRLMAVGPLVAASGHATLLEAMAKLVKAAYPLQLLLIGDGPLAGELKSRADQLNLSSRIEWLPSAPAAALRTRLRGVDALVEPALLPGSGEALLVGMAQGLPCVATRIGAVPERLREGVDGLLVPPADADSLAHAIARLVDSPEFALALSCTARRHMEERHEASRVAVQWADWLKAGQVACADRA